MNKKKFESKLEHDYSSFVKKTNDFKDKISILNKSWEKFMDTDLQVINKHMNPEVYASWKRSKDNSVDPYNYKPIVVSRKDLKKRLEKNRILCEISEICVNAYMESLKGTGFRADLLDPDLILIKQFGEEKNIKMANEQGTFPGVTRQEHLMGTTSGGLAAILNKPVQTFGPEHYKKPLHTWACSSAPIHHNDGTLLGILSLSGFYFQAHEHTLGMSIAISKAIEHCYLQYQIREEMELINKYVDGIINTISDGIIATDEDGNIKIINTMAGQILGVKPESIINKNIQNYLDDRSSIIKTLNHNTSYIDSELLFSNQDKRILTIGSILPVINQNKNIGSLSVFKEMKNATGFVKNVAGFKAFFRFEDILGESPKINSAKSLAKQAAKFDSNILLQGNSGTGKELFAQSIHNESEYKNGPFLSINCGAIPNELIESELFGYEEGAFTGALRGGKPGKFQLAAGGTIFLDEINSMPLNMQVNLLRVLQNRTYMRVGGVDEIPLQSRIISASNKPLLQEVQNGNFREDLFYRLNVIDIQLPTLNECRDDIPIFVEKFLRRTCERIEVEMTIDPDALKILIMHDWPGNIRELENLIEKAVIATLSKGDTVIKKEDLQSYITHNQPCNMEPEKNNLINSIAYNEKKLIARVLQDYNYNKTKTAQALGITRKTLYKKLDDFQLNF